MKKNLKYALILASLSIFSISLNAFTKNKNYRMYGIDYSFYNKKDKKITTTIENKSFYENLGNLAVYYIFKNTPKISEEAKKNIISSKNNLDPNGTLSLNNFLVSDDDEKKIENFLKQIKDKMNKKLNKNKNDEEKVIKYFEKLIKDKNIDVEGIKNSYIQLIKNKIEELEKNIKNLEMQKDNKFFIDFENKKITKDIKNSINDNILKEIEPKKEEELLKKGKESVKKDIKYKKIFIEKLKNDIKEIKKIEKKYLEIFLVNILTAYTKYIKFLQNHRPSNMRYSLHFDFNNTHSVSKSVRYIFLKCFDETLHEEMLKLKDNEHVKNYFKEEEKNIKNTLKDYEKNYNLNKSETKSLHKHLKTLNGSGLEGLLPIHIIEYPTIPNFLNKLNFYSENDEKILDVVISIIKSDKFKQKLKRNLNKKHIKKIKQNYVDYLKFIYSYLKKEVDKTKKENLVEVGKKDLKQYMEYQKIWLDNSKKEKNKIQIKEYEENLNESKETLKNDEILKEKGNETNQNTINAYNNTMNRIKNTIKKIKDAKLEDIKKAFNVIELDGLFKLIDSSENQF